jgi:hypothetical protein
MSEIVTLAAKHHQILGDIDVLSRSRSGLEFDVMDLVRPRVAVSALVTVPLKNKSSNGKRDLFPFVSDSHFMPPPFPGRSPSSWPAC